MMQKAPAKFLLLISATMACAAALLITTAGSYGAGPLSPAQAPPIYPGIEQYRHWDKLSYLEVGDRVWGQSTADPAGSNFDNTHYMRVLTDGQRVLFDQVGPGVMTWMRMQQDYGAPWKLYLDGNYIVTTSPADLGQLNPTGFPASAYPYPLSMHPNQTVGSSIIAATIPFEDSMMWTSVNPNGNFYSLYRKLPYGTPLTTWTGSEPVTDVVSLIRQAGSDIAPANIYSSSGVISLSAGETTITTITDTVDPGSSQLRAIKFRVPFSEKVKFGNSTLRIYWDGENTPSVDAPIKFLAGDGAGVYQPANRPLVQGWSIGAGGDGSTYMDFNLYWPMPFTSTARIAISTTASPPIHGVGWSVRYEPFDEPTGWWGKFHANYTGVITPVNGLDMTYLDITGSGRIVGTIVNFARPDGVLEGDPQFFIDDNNTPQIKVTGTEEWGTGGNYWGGGIQSSLPVGGLPSSVNNPPGEDVDGAALYRILVSDAIPFNRRIVVRWEHGIDNITNNAPYKASIFWYGTPVQTALLTDDLLIGNSASRAAHSYVSPSEQVYTLTAAYEYPVHNPLSTATGISMATVSTFTMALDPNNVGAFLRRQFDYGAANQRARIYIDGQFAGTWYSASNFTGADIDGHVRRWREEEYPLPASLTQDKIMVTVRVEHVPTSDPPNTVWTEFRYQMYSFVMPAGSEPNTPTPTPSNTHTTTPTATGTSTRTHTSTPVASPTNTAVPPTSTTGAASPTGTQVGMQTATGTPIAPTSTRTAAPLTPTETITHGPGPTTTIPMPTATGVIVTATPIECTIEFSDVPAGSTFYASIQCLACRGVLNGYADGTFRPGNNVTRGQLSKIVSNAAGLNNEPGTQRFEDVVPNSTFYLFAQRMAEQGYVSGYPCGGPGEPCGPGSLPYFRPNAEASRGQVAKMVFEASGYQDDPGPQIYEDVPEANVFFRGINVLTNRFVMSGYPCGRMLGEPCNPPENRPYFRPGANASRGQTAKITANTFFLGCDVP